MARRRIGQEQLRLGPAQSRRAGSLDDIAALIDWAEIDRHLACIYAAATGEPGWPPLALFKALLPSVWYDLSDAKPAEALDDRASFRRFRGFAADEPTPERTAFVRVRRELVARRLDRVLFEIVTDQLDGLGVAVKAGTLIDASVIASVSPSREQQARWAGHRRRKPVHDGTVLEMVLRAGAKTSGPERIPEWHRNVSVKAPEPAREFALAGS